MFHFDVHIAEHERWVVMGFMPCEPSSSWSRNTYSLLASGPCLRVSNSSRNTSEPSAITASQYTLTYLRLFKVLLAQFPFTVLSVNLLWPLLAHTQSCVTYSFILWTPCWAFSLWPMTLRLNMYKIYILNSYPANLMHSMRFEVLTALSIMFTAFWHMTPCSLVEMFQHLRRSCLPRIYA
jgi:hypothetical protein